MTGTVPDRERSRPHLKDYLQVLSARRWTLISTVVVVVLGAAVWVLLQKPVYRAEALLLIEPAKVNLTDFKEIYDPTMANVGGAVGQREFFATQCRLIVCRPLLERTFKQFGFGELRQYRDAPDPVADFARHFGVHPERRSRLVKVTFEWPDPELAARALDYLVGEYIADYRRRALGVTQGGLEALRLKAEQLRPIVEAKADTLQQFMVRHNMVSLEKTQNIVVDRLKELNRSLSEVERQKIEYESICGNIQQALDEKRPLEDMPEVAGSRSITDLKLEYIRAKQEVSDLSGRFGPNHPEVVAARARMTAVAEKIQQEITSVLASARAQLERARKQEADLRAELARQEQRVMDFNRLAVRYNILKSDYETTKRTYTAITKRIEEIEIAMAAGSKDDNIFVIMHPRVPPKPARPRKKATLAAAGIVGLILGVGLCFFVDYLDTTIKTKEDVEEVLGLPAIGYVPPLAVQNGAARAGAGAPSSDLVALKKPRSAVAEAFRSIRTALAFSATNGALDRLLVTSCSPKEGKTLVAANIGLALAQAGKRVLLLDADMRRPRLNKVFRVPSRPGLSNLLAGEGAAGIDEVLQPVEGVPNLSVLPCGPMPPNPADLLGSERMKELLDELAGRFDVVVIDTPPVLSVTDAAVLCQYGTGVVMVVRSFATQRKLARQAAELLMRSRGRILGAVINNVDAHRSGYGYYGYGYGPYAGYYGYYYYYSSGGNDTGKPRKRRRHRAGSWYRK